jgi:hypothetical protein
MTAPRSRIETSFTQRGHPLMWANEQEGAVLSGVRIDAYRPGCGSKMGEDLGYCPDLPKYTPPDPVQFGLWL